jgi:hypothetical protein
VDVSTVYIRRKPAIPGSLCNLRRGRLKGTPPMSIVAVFMEPFVASGDCQFRFGRRTFMIIIHKTLRELEFIIEVDPWLLGQKFDVN